MIQQKTTQVDHQIIFYYPILVDVQNDTFQNHTECIALV